MVSIHDVEHAEYPKSARIFVDIVKRERERLSEGVESLDFI